MTHPCEIVVMDILPIIRKELCVEIVTAHGWKQADVARLFGVSGAAVSQYMKGVRGNTALVEGHQNYGQLMHEISISAEKLAKNESDIVTELCKLCKFSKKSGMLDHIFGEEMLTKCMECPKDNILR